MPRLSPLTIRLLTVGLGVAALALTPPAPAASLIPTESTWRWRPGTTEASTPVHAWRAVGFADTDFTPAPAPFWYGDVLPGGTEIRGMQNVYRCVFLRHPFVVTHLNDIVGLRMRALVDDGFVAWINGTEVLRVNMPGAPGGAVTIATLANNAAEPVAFTSYTLPDPSSYLLPGTNVLAVQVFQSSLGSSDLGFEATLEAVLADALPPTVQSVRPAPSSTLDQLTEIEVTFSEPVTGVVAAHLLVNGLGATTVTSTDGTRFTFAFPPPPYGMVRITWNSRQTIADLAEPPNPFDASAPDATWEYTLVDRTPPWTAGVFPAPGATVRTLDRVTVLFSEPVSGVEAADLQVQGLPASDVTRIADSEYVFTFPPPAPGPVALAWTAEHGIHDLAPAANPFAGGSWSYRLDPLADEAPPYLSEFMASNTRTLRDESGRFADWIELHNPSDAPVDLKDWALTDSPEDLTQWRFPSTNLAARGFLVVFATGDNRRVPGAPLHTNFRLDATGEYLALVRPDGMTVATEFGPAYPRQVPDVSFGIAQIPREGGWEIGPRGVYFLQPTPGAPNPGGSAVPGPLLEDIQHTPLVPAAHEDLLVTVRVTASFQPVATVHLRHRIQFGPETVSPMWDDGAHGDGLAGDGLYGATIPAGLASAGQMIRYAVVATDARGAASRWPLFTQPQATPEYLGTIVSPTHVTSRLPVFHLFVAPGQMGAIDTESGGRLSFFYDGEFYDNIYMELRGNTSAGLRKKSHRLEFNRGHELRHAGPGGRTRRSSLLSEYLDPTYLRQHLCFWFLDRIGVPSPFHYPVRVHLNGEFYQLAFHNDVIGQEQIERMGYDPRGALYKAVGNLTPNFSSTGVFQKLEPDDDPTRTDYLQLANGIHESAPVATRRATVFDLLDVPQVINHLAGSRWCAENDDVWANMSLYRDTWGDGLWRCIPFDMNASWGQLYGGSSPLEATVDTSKSHPLYGGSSTGANFNRLYDVIIQLPETRQMLLRRQRSILDLLVQPPETPMENRILEGYIRQMSQLIAPEAALDRARWGFSPWAPGKTFDAGVADLLNQFVVPRRRHWYVTHSVANTARPIGITPSSNAGIPLSQPADASLAFAEIEFNPASGNQAQEFVALLNPSPVALDVSGWKLAGGVTFTFAPGTVVPSNALVYVSPDVRQFRARTSGPRGGQGRFVVGPYRGQLSARGETLTLVNALGHTVASHAYSGAPSPAQQFLRITELLFHPLHQDDEVIPAEDFEFVELRNLSDTVTLDLTGVRFVTGIEFDFSNSAITRLPPGARVLVVANAVAFAARYGPHLPVAGEFSGRLDNGGERLRLLDAANEEILDFTYDDDWHPSTDGGGFALVIADDTAEPDAWGDRRQWRPGAVSGGTPGAGEPPPPPPPGAPTIVVGPLSQSLLPGGPLVLSLAVSPTATLPLGVQVRRNGTPFPLGPDPWIALHHPTFFLTLTGADASPPWTEYSFVVTNAVDPLGVTSAPAHLTYLDDTDADGLPDVWERETLGGLDARPQDDPDTDGFDNRQEYVAGTDPQRASSQLRIDGITPPPAVALRFLAVSNRTYAVQVTDALGTAPWRTLADLTAAPTNRTVEVHDPAPPSHRAYRLVTPRLPPLP